MSSHTESAHIGLARSFFSALPMWILIGFLAAFAVHVGIGLVAAGDPSALLEAGARRLYWRFWNTVLSNPLVAAGVPLLFVLQFLFPARDDEQSFGPSMRIDLLFTLGMVAFYAIVAPPFFVFTRFVYDHTLAGLSVDLTARVAELPGGVQFLLGYLAVDFLGWFHHLVRHHVPGFWEFHAVHHAQRQMNPFTNERVHPVDWFASNVIRFLPAFLFKDSLGVALNYIVIHAFLDRLNHSNVKTNLGWLRYVFVTPQSHRIHHSRQPEHVDKNFGVSLSIWDHLFGTQYRNYDEYPPTGVLDPDYPAEEDGSAKGLIVTLWRELAYPFRYALRPRTHAEAPPPAGVIS
jgi:sterol desaturase/sphingolipid hydroxylase (fatty acid hydroxylase superfamily)